MGRPVPSRGGNASELKIRLNPQNLSGCPLDEAPNLGRLDCIAMEYPVMETNCMPCFGNPSSGCPDGWTRRLLLSVVRRDAHDARMVLGKGANPHLEFERIDLLAERSVRCGTAMTLATISDSLAGCP